MTRSIAPLVALTALLASCADPEVTQVMVTIDADPEIKRLARTLDVEIYGGVRTTGGIPREGPEQVPIQVFDADPDDDESPWPVTIALAPRDEDASRQYRIIVTARQGDRFIARVKAISGYTRGETLWLRLYIDRFCLFVEECTEEDETCAGGVCVDARTPENRLPRFGEDAGPVVVCESAADCDDGIACTTDDCVSARCTATADDSVCTDGPDGVCDPMTGCQYSTCEVGTTCLAGPCEIPSCEGTTCVRTPMCVGGETCCGGTCMDCDDGNGCTIDGCDGAGCTHVARDGQPCEDLRYCDGSETCVGSTCTEGAPPCTAPLMCDEATASCLNCTSDDQCADDVMTGPCTAVSGMPVCSTMGVRTVTTVVRRCVGGTCAADPPMSAMESCVRTTDGLMCSDGLFCNGPDRCSGGSCAPGSTNPCPAGTMCIESSDSCFMPPMDGGMRDGGRTDGCTGPEICMNGLDDDCDLAVDCADSDCAAAPVCDRDAGFDACTGAELCMNGLDDDCDFDVDCADSDCAGDPMCDLDAGFDACTGPELCMNGLDDDCDLDVDCDDPDCAGDPMCNLDAGFDAGDDPTCVAGPEPNCTNGLDDNCNGATDCADSSCVGRPGCTSGSDSGTSALDSGGSTTRDGGLPLP